MTEDERTEEDVLAELEYFNSEEEVERFCNFVKGN